jgi:hypothetical protein
LKPDMSEAGVEEEQNERAKHTNAIDERNIDYP